MLVYRKREKNTQCHSHPFIIYFSRIWVIRAMFFGYFGVPMACDDDDDDDDSKKIICEGDFLILYNFVGAIRNLYFLKCHTTFFCCL